LPQPRDLLLRVQFISRQEGKRVPGVKTIPFYWRVDELFLSFVGRSIKIGMGGSRGGEKLATVGRLRR
jgi:hypothetical protein